MKLLHIDSSALGGYSVSRQLSASIVAEWQRHHPEAKIRYRDLAAEPLAHWTPAMDDSAPAAQINHEILEEFLAADVLVIGAPMYNFAISSQLKAWIDRILVAGKTFRYTASGAEGLALGKRVIVASSRGGFYGKDSAAAPMDFQEPYLRSALGFIGIADIEFVRAEGLAVGDEQKTAALKSARGSIETLFTKAA
jgi:FMN-dependent NADH-azoreductase